MSGDVSFYDLVNASIGTPDTGVVNFTALQTLLHAMLKHLEMEHVTVRLHNGDLASEVDRQPRTKGPWCRCRGLEDKLRRIETQIAALEELPTGAELLERSSSSNTPVHATPVHDMWQLMQVRRRIQINEDGVSKSMALIQDLLKEIQDLKEFRDALKQEVRDLHAVLEKVNTLSLADRISAMEGCCHRVEDLEAATRLLEEKMVCYPEPELLEELVTWDGMQSALLSEREKLQKELASGVQAAAPGDGSVSPATDRGRPSPPGRAAEAGSPPARPRHPLTPPGDTLGGPVALSPLPPLPPPGGETTPAGRPLPRAASGAERHPETVEELRKVGRLTERHGELEARVAALEAGKAERAQLEHLAQLVSDAEVRDLPEDLMEHITLLRSQVDEKLQRLQETSQHLLEDHTKRQSHIQQLYKLVEELQEKKVDKQQLEMEIKADKCALESKVSQLQLDAMTDQLSTMFHELLSKVTDQEQDWQQVVQRLSAEMERKLNRIELEPLKKQLESRWQVIRRKLQSQPAPEQEDAAGIRKQLVTRFHCISCSRPVDLQVPGSHLVTVPPAPGLPAHRSNRPHTVYELDQVRQHCRGERIPETADYSYRCGGSHTVTSRRSARFQHISHLYQAETESQPPPLRHTPMSSNPEGLDILGLDGHVYKGRLNARTVRTTDPRLPNIPPGEGVCKSGNKALRSQSQSSGAPESGPPTPVRPQSAKNGPASHASGSPWSASSQGSVAEDPGPQHRRTTEMHIDLRPSQEEGPGTNQ